MASTTAHEPGVRTGTSFGSAGYRSYVLFTLTAIYALNFVDRVLISVLSRPIIEEFGLSNLQFGLLAGIGFALFYTVLGIPIARLSERVQRVWVIGASVILWSLATVLCGYAVGFVTLLLARVLVGIGEAGCTPPANSLLCDYYAPERRPFALGVYAMGVLLGSVFAQLAGGYILNNFTWREAFVFIGAPGVLIGLLTLVSVREPPRGYSDPPGSAPAPGGTLLEALVEIVRKPTFLLIATGMSLASFAGYGTLSFVALFIQYEYGMSPGDTAIRILAPVNLAGAVGTFVAGWVIVRWSRHTDRAAIWVPAVGFFVSAPVFVWSYLADGVGALLLAQCLASLFFYSYIGASYTIVQSVVSLRVRATAIALILFLINLVGYGGGPPFVGALADYFANAQLVHTGMGDVLDHACNPRSAAMPGDLVTACVQAKAHGMRWALIIGSSVFVLAGLFYCAASRYYRADRVLG